MPDRPGGCQRTFSAFDILSLPPRLAPMSAARVLLVYLVAIFLGGALLAPWLWEAVQALAGNFPSLRHTAEQPFHRYVNRCLLAIALLGLWPLVRAFRVRSRAELGWNGPWGPAILRGFLLGFGALGLVTLLGLLAGTRTWVAPTDLGRWLGRLGSAALSAAVVSCLEEFLFRGVLHGVLRRTLGFLATAASTSALYSWVHFFERPPRPEHVDAWTGLWTLGQMLRGFTSFSSLIPGWLSLVVAGVALALARERTGSLAFPIGLHAGWIFWLKAYGFATSDAPGANPTIWGTGRLFDGWLALALLALQAFLIHAWIRPQPNGRTDDPTTRTIHP